MYFNTPTTTTAQITPFTNNTNTNDALLTSSSRLHTIHNQNFPRRTSSHLSSSTHYTLNHKQRPNHLNISSYTQVPTVPPPPPPTASLLYNSYYGGQGDVTLSRVASSLSSNAGCCSNNNNINNNELNKFSTFKSANISQKQGFATCCNTQLPLSQQTPTPHILLNTVNNVNEINTMTSTLRRLGMSLTFRKYL